MNATDKVTKLLALARDPAATPSESATAQRLADQICSKYGVSPRAPTASGNGSNLALKGNVSPAWQPRDYAQPSARNIFRNVPDKNLSGISIEDARRMALDILLATQSGQCYLGQGEEFLIQQAFDGLLTDFGKILLMGLHAVVVG